MRITRILAVALGLISFLPVAGSAVEYAKPAVVQRAGYHGDRDGYREASYRRHRRHRHHRHHRDHRYRYY